MGRVSLVMIARDEERCIARALDSAAPYVDEMIVLDTGSNDGTVAIARRCGARVEHFVWGDDFAAAKNAALALATWPTRLILDADEWLVSGGDRLRHVELPTEGVGWVTVRSQLEQCPSSATEAPFASDRLVRVVPAVVRFRGAVHEQPVYSGPAIPTEVIAGHDGYLPAQNERKRGRNERLLARALAIAPDAYLHYQMAKDLEVQERYAESADHYSTALGMSDGREAWRHALVTRALFVFSRAARFDDAVVLFEREARRWPESPDLFFAAGGLFLAMTEARPGDSAALLDLARNCWRRCLEIGERPDLPGAVPGRGSHLARHNVRVVSEPASDLRATTHTVTGQELPT